MDFNDFVRENMAKYGSPDDGEISSEKKYVDMLTFNRNPKKDGVMSHYKAKPTFINPWDYEGEEVLPGDTYICSLSPTYDGTSYYATPIKKVDMSVIMATSQEFIKVAMDKIWENHKDQIMDRFRDRYLDEVTKNVAEGLEEKHRDEIDAKEQENESLRAEIHRLRSQADAREWNPEMTAESGATAGFHRLTSDEIVLSSDEAADEEPDEPVVETTVEEAPQAVAEPEFPPIREHPSSLEMKYPVFEYRSLGEVQRPEYDNPMVRVQSPVRYRVSIFSNSITCDSFINDARYFVHVSPDKRNLLIRPNEYGTVTCVNHTISVAGLDRLYSKKEGQMSVEYTGEYNPNLEGMLIKL